METKTFSIEQNEWLNDLAYWMIQLGVFEEQPIKDIRSKIDENAFLEYLDSGFTAKEAVEEDLTYN